MNEILQRLRAKPLKFYEDVFEFIPWEKQVEIINAIETFDRVTARSCNAAGKTAIAARIAIKFLTLNRNSLVLTTSLPSHT